MNFCLSEFSRLTSTFFSMTDQGAQQDQQLAGVSIDSRTLSDNEVFFAIRGKKFDGHDFVAPALTNGAMAVVVDAAWWSLKGEEFADRLVMVVEDTTQALQDFANYFRKKHDIPVLGLTGTNGKTTTKEMVAAVLGQTKAVCKTEGNFNNHIGVPLTIFQLRADHDFLILEMATNHFGEIERLCEIGEPFFGLITNIGHGHTEFLTDLNGVARAKLELFDSLQPEGLAFANLDDPIIVKYLPRYKRCTTFGFRDEADVVGKNLGLDDAGFPSIQVGDTIMKINVMGLHNVYNALAAVAVGLEIGVPLPRIQTALAEVRLPSKRMQIERKGEVTLINDTYNANPESMLAALDTLCAMPCRGKRIAVMGDMLELGNVAPAAHQDIVDSVLAKNVAVFFTYGKLFGTSNLSTDFQTGGTTARHFSDKVELSSELTDTIDSGDLVLIKGSRGMRMEEIIDSAFD